MSVSCYIVHVLHRFILHPGGYSPKICVGMCGALLETLTLFQTKICDFSHPFSDLTQNLIPWVLTIYTNHPVGKSIYKHQMINLISRKKEKLQRRGVNRGMQIRRSVLCFGPIRRSDVIFVQIRICKNFPWFKYTAYRYIYLFSFSSTVSRFGSKVSVFAGVLESSIIALQNEYSLKLFCNRNFFGT